MNVIQAYQPVTADGISEGDLFWSALGGQPAQLNLKTTDDYVVSFAKGGLPMLRPCRTRETVIRIDAAWLIPKMTSMTSANLQIGDIFIERTQWAICVDRPTIAHPVGIILSTGELFEIGYGNSSFKVWEIICRIDESRHEVLYEFPPQETPRIEGEV